MSTFIPDSLPKSADDVSQNVYIFTDGRLAEMDRIAGQHDVCLQSSIPAADDFFSEIIDIFYFINRGICILSATKAR